MDARGEFMVVATQKAWTGSGKNLVSTEDVNATRLVARAGLRVKLSEVQNFPNYREFFKPAKDGEQFPEDEPAPVLASSPRPALPAEPAKPKPSK